MIDVTFHGIKKISIKKKVGSMNEYAVIEITDRKGNSSEIYVFVDDPDALNVFNETEDEAK